ncbi:MAG: CRISPR-associated helicase Cas3' [Candidatus Spyradocola sp.]
MEQTLEAHCRNAAGYAAAALAGTGLEDAGFLAGLLHDLGKATERFQRYLLDGEGARGSVIHSFQGCRWVLERYHGAQDDDQRFAAEIVAYAVAAHHGLMDCVDESHRSGFRLRVDRQDIGFEEAAARFLAECAGTGELDERFRAACEGIQSVAGRLSDAFEDDGEFWFCIGMMARLVLSAVIEGDRRDTAAFLNDAQPPVWGEDMRPIWRARLAFLEGKLAGFAADTPVNAARREISARCRAFAERPGGIYRLNVPTGGGKTLSSLRYALAHAARWNKRRIVFTSPLLSILDQKADVIREYVGDDKIILEHHSNVVQTRQDADAQDSLDERELLTDSWGAPIIITTLVQLLNTLFDGRTTAVRRLQGLVNSVIVVDEVQTVPTRMLTLFNLGMRFLAEACGATVVLCSATQPCLERAEHPLGIVPEQIVPHDEALWQPFRRTNIIPLGRRRLEELPGLVRGLMEGTRSLLVVCNTKREARVLFEALKGGPWRCFHLSASMCVQHRRDTLAALKAALEAGERTLCISTQVIEAGVDISFGSVLRLVAGMDSVVQSAGRCNRSGEFPGLQPVYLVECVDENLGRLKEIQSAKTATTALLEDCAARAERYGGDLASDAAIAFYYRALYRAMDVGAQDYIDGGVSLFDLLSLNDKYADDRCAEAENWALKQAFREAGRRFNVFEDNTVDVIVPYGEGERIIEALRSGRAMRDVKLRAELLEQAKPYTAALYSYQIEQMRPELVCGCAYVLDKRHYDEQLGVAPGGKELEFLGV